MDSSIVLKARTALHNAAAKAERVLIELKADIKAERSRFSNTEAERTLTELRVESEAECLRSLTTEANSIYEEFCIDGKLPWIGICKYDKCDEGGEYRKQILEVSKRPDEFLENKLEGAVTIDLPSEMPFLGAILEHDENLRNLRLEYVPKKMEEEDFWRHYFIAVKKVKQQILGKSSAQIRFSIDEKCGGKQTRDSEAKMQHLKKDVGEEAVKRSIFVAASIPPLKSLKRLASAIEAGRTVRSLQELAVADKDSSQASDWSSLVSGLANVRKLTSWEKDSKGHTIGQRPYQNVLSSLFDAGLSEEDFTLKELSQPVRCKLIDEIHGAPPQSFVARLAEALSGMKTTQKMAEFWLEVVKELRHHWSESMAIPCLPVDTNPDLSYCLLHQQLQVINCCIARRKRRISALESLEMLEKSQASTLSPMLKDDIGSLYAKQKDGELVMRLGVDHVAAELMMLETGEPIYPPITQDDPVLTEDLIKEKEELVLRTGSSGAGCLHLFSDMKAFKAANPGCILEDFVRWYSPLDWREHSGSGLLDNDSSPEKSTRGSLSARMQSEGNLWQELWTSACPVPAVRQAPLYDEELAGESTLDALEAIDPASLFEQLFITTLGIGFSVAEAAPCAKAHPLEQCLSECRDYVVSTCGHDMSSDILDHLCKVYDFMVAAVHSSPEESSLVKLFSLDKSVFKLNNLFQTSDGSEQTEDADTKDPDAKILPCKQEPHHAKGGGRINVMVRLLEAKASIFDRKPKSSSNTNQYPCSVEADWTLI